MHPMIRYISSHRLSACTLLSTTIMISLMLSFPAWAADSIMVGDFAKGDLTEWEHNSFVGKTIYKVKDGKLASSSNSSASGLVRKIPVDLNKTPFLNWSWKVGQSSLIKSPTHNERSKEGDDYAVRIYIVIDGGWTFWKTRALNYVWSSNQSIGESWENAYTSNAIMLAVDSGEGDIGVWRNHKRDIRKDLKHYLGLDADHIDAIAIMSDTDNTGGKTDASYGNIFFSSQ